MATRKRRTPVRRKRKTLKNAKKAYRFVKKQRRRRSKMHPNRRRQENVALFGWAATLPLLIFVGLWAGFFVFFGSIVASIASKSSPPRGWKPHKNVTRPKDWATVSKKELIRKQQKALTCSDPCKYSTHDISTCTCICRTWSNPQHGVWAWRGGNRTMPQGGRRGRRN